MLITSRELTLREQRRRNENYGVPPFNAPPIIGLVFPNDRLAVPYSWERYTPGSWRRTTGYVSEFFLRNAPICTGVCMVTPGAIAIDDGPSVLERVDTRLTHTIGDITYVLHVMGIVCPICVAVGNYTLVVRTTAPDGNEWVSNYGRI